MQRDQWLTWPLAEQAFTLALLVCVAPGVWAVWAMAHGLVLLGILAAAVWAVPFGLLVRILHTRRAARLAVTIPCIVFLLAVAALV
jgi:hypothetical protein